jgi:hypothetical protein
MLIINGDRLLAGRAVEKLTKIFEKDDRPQSKLSILDGYKLVSAPIFLRQGRGLVSGVRVKLALDSTLNIYLPGCPFHHSSPFPRYSGPIILLNESQAMWLYTYLARIYVAA